MLKFFMYVLSYGVYPALVYNFLYPSSPYFGYLENFITMYKVYAVLCLLFMGFVALILHVAGTVAKAPGKAQELIEDLEGDKLDAVSKGLNDLSSIKSKPMYWVGRFCSLFGLGFSFIFVGDYFLGMIFGTQIILSEWLYYSATSMLNTIKNKVEDELGKRTTGSEG